MCQRNECRFVGVLFKCLVAGVVTVVLCLMFGASARAASRFWTGNQDGRLSAPGNWVGNAVPLAGDELIFQPNSSVSRTVVTNDFSPNRAFNAITFQGTNYFLRGNPILITNGISCINSTGTNTIDADVEVRASQAWEATGPLAVFNFNGDINLNANTLTVKANTGDFFFSGVMSGTGNLVKTNVGTLRMSGAGHNTYSGFTRFDGGILELNKFALLPTPTNFISIPGDLSIGDGNGLVGTDVFRLLADDQIADSSDVTVKNSGIFNLNGHDERIGSLTMQGGTITNSGSGILILGGNLTTLTDSQTALIEGNLSLGGASRLFNVSPGSPAADLRINATISSGTSAFLTAGFTKAGSGTLYLSGTNVYNGTTTINDGQITVLSDRALGVPFTPLGVSAGTVVNSNGNLFLNGVQVTNEALTINSANPGGAFNANGASVWTGNILLNTNTFISSSGSLLLNGTITGPGGFTKLGTGSMTLSGTNANTYTGTTIVRDGTLLLDKDIFTAMDGAMSGPLIIGEDELPENTDVVRYLRASQLPDDTDITINSSGLLDLNGFGENVRNLVFNGGDIDTGSTGSILPIGDITVNANLNSMAIISGRMSVLASPIIDVTGHNFSPDLRIDAQLHGAGSLTKNGIGEVGLTASNIYSGLTIINNGTLIVDNSSALGSTASGTIVKAGGELTLRFGVAVLGETLGLAGNGDGTFGALNSLFGSNFWSGSIGLSNNATIYVDSGDFLNLSNAVVGAYNLSKTGTGRLIFSGAEANSFNALLVKQGTMALDKAIANGAGPDDLTIGDGSGIDTVILMRDNQIADTTPVHLALGGRLDLNDNDDTVGSIDGRGIVDLGTGTLREGADGGSSTLSGTIVGSGSIFKLGLGTWTLDGDNTYMGQTTVSAGTLIVNGDQHQSAITVNGTANLGGTGVVGDLQVFGSLRPGTSPGILTSSNVNFAAQGDYFVELNGAIAGTGYDQLNVRGTNQLGGSTLHVSLGAGFAPMEGQNFTIINNDGTDAIQGTFSGLPNNAVFTAGNLQFLIRYSDIFMNDVVLTVTNTALKIATNTVSVVTGNGNGEVEPGECNLLFIPLMNKLAGVVSGVSAVLSSTNAGVTVTQPFSGYSNLPANSSRTNTTPFQISTAPTLACGTNIDLVLTVSTFTNGVFQVPIRLFLGSPGATNRFDQNVDVGIPDLGTVDSLLNVAGFSGALARVSVSTYITHTAVGDLVLSLIAPDGTTIHLSSGNGGTGDDYGVGEADGDRTAFSDLAALSIMNGTPPFRGTFRPEEPLTAFRGKFGSAVNGTWRLRIVDSAGGSVGTLRAWSLFLSPLTCAPGGGVCDPPCPACPVRLDIVRDASNTNNVLLRWTTAAIGYNVVATNMLGTAPHPFAPIAVSPVVVIGSKFTQTNGMTTPTRFYELRKP